MTNFWSSLGHSPGKKGETGFNTFHSPCSPPLLWLPLRLHIACGNWQHGQVAATIVARTVAVKWKNGQGRGNVPTSLSLQCICTQMLFIFSPTRPAHPPFSLVQQVGPAGSLITFYWRARTQARSGPGWPTFWPDNFLIPKPLPCTAAVRAAKPELLLNWLRIDTIIKYAPRKVKLST